MTTYYLSTGSLVVKGDILANDTLSGLSARNGVTPVDGDIMVATAQTDHTTNGPYITRSAAWDRIISVQTAQLYYVASGTDAGVTFQLRTAGISPASFNPVTGVCGTNLTITSGVTGGAGSFTTLSATSIGPDAGHQFTLPSVPSSTVLVSGASSSTDQSLQVGDSTHRWGSLSVLTVNSGDLGGTLLSAVADGSGVYAASAWRISETTSFATGGSGILYLATAGTNQVGILKIGCPSLGQTDALCYAETLTASGTITAGQVVVWSGTKKVAAAAASANLTTIAGIALTAGTTNNPMLVARRGRCYALADAGISAGQLLGTSGSVAGNVGSGTPGSGALVGRACEATAGTVAGTVLLDLILG